MGDGHPGGVLVGLFWVVVYDGGSELLTRRSSPPALACNPPLLRGVQVRRHQQVVLETGRISPPRESRAARPRGRREAAARGGAGRFRRIRKRRHPGSRPHEAVRPPQPARLRAPDRTTPRVGAASSSGGSRLPDAEDLVNRLRLGRSTPLEAQRQVHHVVLPRAAQPLRGPLPRAQRRSDRGARGSQTDGAPAARANDGQRAALSARRWGVPERQRAAIRLRYYEDRHSRRPRRCWA